MADARVIDWLDRHKFLSARRDQNFNLWQNLADILHPTRGAFTTEMREGQEASPGIYDSTPMQARRGLATAIDGLLKPSTSRWFWMKSDEDALNEDDQVKRWFDGTCDRMWRAIYSPDSRFVQQSTAVDNDLATFGLGYLWVGENRRHNGLFFRAIHISRVAIDENADGIIDTATIVLKLTARQAEQRFGRDNLGPKCIEALTANDSKQADKTFEFVQCIYPNEKFNPARADAVAAPYSSLIICKNDETLIDESGFQEFPLACPRWEVMPGHIYPRSPGMLALPDARTLQAMGFTLLTAGQKAVDPPLWAIDDGVLSAVRTFPGGITTVSADAIRDTGGRPLGVLEMGKNIPIGREMQQDYRAMVEAAFFKNVFNLPIDVRNMTATEIMARKEEFLRTVGPTMAQLETDYIGVMIARVFGIMQRAGAFEAPPEELKNARANFEFMSPVQQAKRQIEAAGMRGAMDFIMPFIQLQPEIADNFDGDEIARDLPEAFSLREKWLRSKDDVAQLRQSRQQHQQQQMGLTQLEQGGKAAASFGAAGKSIAEAAAAANPVQAIAGVQQAQGGGA